MLDKELISANELAKRFSVSIRTIQRDMETLNLAGIPIFTQSGQAGGYGLVREYKISNRLLSNEDFVNLITALKSIQGTFADKRFLGSLERIYSLISPKIHENLKERENTLYIDFSLPGQDSILAEKIRTIEHAITQRRLIECLYTSHKQESIARLLEPMTLILQWGSWYLFAYCRTRSDFRLFKVSRINEIKVQQEHYIRRDKTYQEFIIERPNFQNSKLINLVFVVDKSMRAYVEENHPSHELEYQHDGSIIVRCVQPEENRMYRYLLSYGDAIKITEPLYVKEKVKEIARKIISS